MGSSSSFISFGMEGILSTFQKIIYRRINKQRCIMLTSGPFYVDINKLITVVTHCLDISTITLFSVYRDLYSMLYLPRVV